MSRRTRLVIGAVLVALLVLASGGLALARMRQQSPNLPSAVTQHPWRLDSFTFDGQPQVLVPGASITISFQSQSQLVGGFNGCNAYGATYAASQSRLQLSEMRQTLIACLQPGVSQQEAHYMTALALITTYQLDQSGLTLRDASGRYTLHYAATAS